MIHVRSTDNIESGAAIDERSTGHRAVRLVRVVTIGAGIVGASCAYHLARAGADVTVVDTGTPGHGTSGATFAWLNAFRKRPRPYYDLARSSLHEYRSLAKEVLAEDYVHWDGGLHLESTSEGREALEKHVQRLLDWGYDVEFLSPRRVRELHEPGIALDDVVGDVVRTPQEGWVEVVPLIRQLLTAAREHGASVEYPADVRSLSAAPDGGITVHVQDGRTIDADAVVLSAGHSAQALAETLDLHLPIERRPGLLAISRPTVASVKHVVYAPEVHFRPDSGGRLLMGLGSHDRHEVSPPPEKQKQMGLELVDVLTKRLPTFHGTDLESTRIGVRPIPIDGFPVVGWMSNSLPVYAAVSHSGVTLGPGIGRACADEIVRGRAASELEGFRPGRFAAA